jgi:hypothetical protein
VEPGRPGRTALPALPNADDGGLGEAHRRGACWALDQRAAATWLWFTATCIGLCYSMITTLVRLAHRQATVDVKRFELRELSLPMIGIRVDSARRTTACPR